MIEMTGTSGGRFTAPLPGAWIAIAALFIGSTLPRMFAGTLELDSRPGYGTTVPAFIPLQEARA